MIGSPKSSNVMAVVETVVGFASAELNFNEEEEKKRVMG